MGDCVATGEVTRLSWDVNDVTGAVHARGMQLETALWLCSSCIGECRWYEGTACLLIH
jgi:hypothetical protein